MTHNENMQIYGNESMQIYGIIPTEEFHRVVDDAISQLDPQVVARVRYNVGTDHVDEPLLRVRIILRDEVFSLETLHDVASGVRTALKDRIRSMERWGLRVSFSFRTESEQKALNDPEWN
jgi:hypothetical protein